MGVFEIRSRNWQEMRWPIVMAAVFNGLSFLVALLTLILAESLLLPALVAVAAFCVTVLAIVALQTRGGTSSETQTVPLA